MLRWSSRRGNGVVTNRASEWFRKPRAEACSSQETGLESSATRLQSRLEARGDQGPVTEMARVRRRRMVTGCGEEPAWQGV